MIVHFFVCPKKRNQKKDTLL